MANTTIQILRSYANTTPPSLHDGELAYSFVSNTLFIGTSNGTGVVNVGGQYYTSQVDNATDAATGSTLVRRDASGNASFNYVFANTIYSSIEGNANTATALQTARNFSISGGDVSASSISFDGTGDVTLNASLNAVTGLSAGTYGGTTAIPVVTVAANGRVMAIANTTLSTSFTIAGDTGTDTFDNGNTLTFTGGDGITTAVTDNTVSFAVDTTVFRSNTAIVKQTVDGDVEISGNLIVLGTQTTVNVSTLTVDDSLIALARNNTTDAVDVGFYGHYDDGTPKHAGVFRHAGDQEFYVFDNYTAEPTANTINPASNNFRVATLNANLKAQFANVATLNVGTVNISNANLSSLLLGTALTVPNGGTGATSFNNGSILVGSGTGALTTLANSTFTPSGTGSSNSTITSVTVDAYGRFTAATFQSISDLSVSQGGTGTNTFTAGQILVGDGSNSIKQIANVTAVSATVGSANTVNSFTTDVYGRVTAFTQQKISGLQVDQGGTGQSSFTAGQLIVGDGTNGLKQLANTGTAGTYGSGTAIPVITTDAYGRVSSITTVTPSTPILANGSYYLAISSVDGIVSSNGAGFLLKNGAVIKDNSDNAVAFGENAGTIGQGAQAVAIGDSAGYNTQGAFGIAIGYGAGNQNQSQVAVAIGLNAGMSNQGYNGIAIGNSAGSSYQGTGAIALGYSAGSGSGNYSIAIGYESAAGNTSAIGANAIALGYKAGFETAYAGSIILNASGSNLSSSNAGFYINPVRYTEYQDNTYDGLMFYNSNTKEARYSYSLDGGSF